MSGQSIANLGKAQGPNDAVRRKYANDRFFKKGNSIDTIQKTIKNVLSPIEEGAITNHANILNRDNKPQKHFESSHQKKMFEHGLTRNSNK